MCFAFQARGVGRCVLLCLRASDIYSARTPALPGTFCHMHRMWSITHQQYRSRTRHKNRGAENADERQNVSFYLHTFASGKPEFLLLLRAKSLHVRREHEGVDVGREGVVQAADDSVGILRTVHRTIPIAKQQTGREVSSGRAFVSGHTHRLFRGMAREEAASGTI